MFGRAIGHCAQRLDGLCGKGEQKKGVKRGARCRPIGDRTLTALDSPGVLLIDDLEEEWEDEFNAVGAELAHHGLACDRGGLKARKGVCGRNARWGKQQDFKGYSDQC